MVTAKFRVTRITAWNPGGVEAILKEGEGAAEIELTPDYAHGKNAEWAAATPSGVIRLNVANVNALKQFVSDNPQQDQHPGYMTGKSMLITFQED